MEAMRNKKRRHCKKKKEQFFKKEYCIVSDGVHFSDISKTRSALAPVMCTTSHMMHHITYDVMKCDANTQDS